MPALADPRRRAGWSAPLDLIVPMIAWRTARLLRAAW